MNHEFLVPYGVTIKQETKEESIERAKAFFKRKLKFGYVSYDTIPVTEELTLENCKLTFKSEFDSNHKIIEEDCNIRNKQCYYTSCDFVDSIEDVLESLRSGCRYLASEDYVYIDSEVAKAAFDSILMDILADKNEGRRRFVEGHEKKHAEYIAKQRAKYESWKAEAEEIGISFSELCDMKHAECLDDDWD